MPSILFVCTGNQYRSPLAAAVFRKELGRLGMDSSWVVASAGTWAKPGQLPFPSAIQLGGEMGFDLSNHRTREVSASELAKHDLILVMERGHKEALRSEFPSFRRQVYMLSEVVDRLTYDIPDPADPHVDARQALSFLEKLVVRGTGRIIELAESLQVTQ